MNENYFIGIDLGTTGVKMILLGDDGVLVDQDNVDYDVLTPEKGYVEQRPSDWWNGLCKISNNLVSRNKKVIKKVKGIGIAGQMHTHVYLDKDNNPIGNAITWMDQRSEEIVKKLSEEYNDIIFKNTSNFITTTYSAPQITWMKENKSDLFNKTVKILLAKDYIKFKLTGEMITDYSDAAGTLLFDVKNKKWSSEMFDLFGIDKGLMPEVDKSNAIIGKISKEAAETTGLPADIPVINGSADHAATSLGAGVVSPGQASAIIGTAGVVSVLSDEPVADPEHRILCWNYCLEDKWVNMAVMQTAGQSLNWFRKAFDEGKDNIYQDYNNGVKEISAGSEGLIFLPYLMGERSPYWDAKTRGMFFGINLNHNKYHFVRSIMEGVSFAFKNNIEIIESLGNNIKELRILGGGSKSVIWKNIFAQITNKKLLSLTIEETGALGSSIMTGVALGIYESIDLATQKIVSVNEEIYEDEFSDIYKNNYEIFKKLYENNKDLFAKL